MPIRRALRLEENVNDSFRRLDVDLPGPERENVRIIMLAAVSCKCFVVRGRGKDTGYFVGRHGRADSGAIHHDSEACSPRGDEISNRFGDPGIVDRIFAMRSEIVNGVTLFTQISL